MRSARNTWHKVNPGVTRGTCGAIGERAQVILLWVRGPGSWECFLSTKTKSQKGKAMAHELCVAYGIWILRMLKNTSIKGVS